MKKIPYGKKLNEFSLWCCNCEDKISQGSVMEIKDMTSSNHGNRKQEKKNGHK